MLRYSCRSSLCWHSSEEDKECVFFLRRGSFFLWWAEGSMKEGKSGLGDCHTYKVTRFELFFCWKYQFILAFVFSVSRVGPHPSHPSSHSLSSSPLFFPFSYFLSCIALHFPLTSFPSPTPYSHHFLTFSSSFLPFPLSHATCTLPPPSLLSSHPTPHHCLKQI